MSKKSSPPAIRLRGVRHNNLKNFDLDLPLHQLIVITGLSGSGKSSLAFDTLFAEGQRRYIETFSPYARQFFDRMDKPQVDSIDGIPPAIAIEQRNSVKSTRSTVGTMTEICDYMKLLWPQVARLFCKQCGRPVRKDSPQHIWESIAAAALDRSPNQEVLITFDVPLSEKLSLDESLALISKQGYQRLLLDDEILRLEDAIPRLRKLNPGTLTILQDRLKPSANHRARFVEACEQAYHFGKGKLAIRSFENNQLSTLNPQPFSNRLHCATCDIEYREPSPALFSFNHPVGACPACRGFGRIITIDYDLALPDRSKTLAECVVRPWQTGQSAECQSDMMKFCKLRKVPINVPFHDLSQKWQDWVINGDPNYGKDKQHEWPRAWYGVKGYFRWLESKSYKMHVRVLLSRYRSYTPCPDCHGRRFQPEALLYKIAIDDLPSTPYTRKKSDETPSNGSANPKSQISLADFYQLPVRDAFRFIEQLAARHSVKKSDPLGLVLNEVRARLGFLNDVGLGYLTLDRPTRSLSGGETERVNLTTCLGTRLVNTLFVLDEPSVGLHPRDTARLVRILEQLRDAGNTVVVVEHEASVMRAANQIIDLGPGHGATGGQIVFQGPFAAILKSPASLTGQYLSGKRRIEIPARRSVRLTSSPLNRSEPLALREYSPRYNAKTTSENTPILTLSHATLHNLQDLIVEIPLARFVCITGVSGSGKTTLAREVLLPLLNSKFKGAAPTPADSENSNDDSESDSNSQLPTPNSPTLKGWESLGRVVLVDQSTLGKTPRSNPAVYIGAFDDLRELFAQAELARQRGLGASAFSFNSTQGQCERCRGAGFEKIEMQFLSDVYIRCPDCGGRRYRAHILDVKLAGSASELPSVPQQAKSSGKPAPRPARREKTARTEWSIADLLEATVDDAIRVLSSFSKVPAGRRAVHSLKLLQEVGLGYLRLGQPINTLSGGESQRLKLVSHLAEFERRNDANAKPTLFMFDEPTTGLHFDDIRVLLKVFQRLVDAGHSLLVIEHNLEVIKCADWIVDLGPEAGAKGGRVVVEGAPGTVAACAESHTGRALAPLLK